MFLRENMKKRIDSIDLLKCLSMLMVVVLHLNGYGLQNVEYNPYGIIGFARTILQSFSIVGVNLFVLISGYFLCSKQIGFDRRSLLFYYKRLLPLWIQVEFYSIGIYLLEHNDNIRVIYVDAESFSQDFINSLNEDKIAEFKKKYREADVLLVDDIQFLEGKEGFQEEFYHTFNALYNVNKQIIISGDRPPSKLTKLDERLRSRFAWNMIAEVQPPDYETRVAILLKKAHNLNVEVSENVNEIINLLANKIKDNIRDMEGAFNSIISLSRLTGENLDIDFAKMVLKDIVISNDIITPEKIKSAVSKYFKIKVSDLNTETRKISIAYPRQIAMYLCRTMTDYSLPKIGGIFGNKHYSTVKHACDKIEGELKINKDLMDDIEEIKALILS